MISLTILRPDCFFAHMMYLSVKCFMILMRWILCTLLGIITLYSQEGRNSAVDCSWC